MSDKKISPREYQKKIVSTCLKENTLVVLPTGTGKTLIAIIVAKEMFEKNPLKKVLILAPTRPLVEQHLESFKKVLGENWAEFELFTGKTPSKKRKKIWETAEFVFSTPQCISNDLKNALYDLSQVSLIVFDECHRCLKNYSYNKIAKKYLEQSPSGRVVGLTASPGSDKKTIEELCKNLSVSALEIRTRESPDVKPYLKTLEFEKIEIDFPPEFLEIKKLLDQIMDEKIQELKNRNVLKEPPSKTNLLKLQSKLIFEIRENKDLNKMYAVSACAQALKISHAIEVLETQTLSAFINYLKELFKQAKEKKSKGAQKLSKDKRLIKAYTLALSINFEHPKLPALKKIVEEQFKKNKGSKIIVFAQLRETVLKIAEILSRIPGVVPKTFVGQAIKEHEGSRITGLNQKEQKKIIEQFKKGEINVLVATSIAEEGLDIPEVNEVIFYEPVPSAIRKIQRAGRTARLLPGKLKILVTKNTRDQAYHYSAFHKEKKMIKSISFLKKDFEKNKKEGSDGKKT